MLKTGISNTINHTVSEADTAKALGSGLLDVLSTPALVAWMEEAALKIPQGELGEGESTVGISMNVKHLAATPVGLEVIITAVLTAIDRKKLTFEISACDRAGLVGTAIHERFIVDNAKFISKVYSK